MLVAKKPVDVLRSLGAPRELVEWVGKMPADEAVRRAWIDVTKVDWLPYLALLRGLSTAAVVRATCACAVEIAAPSLVSPQGERISAVLADASMLAAAEQQLEDLRLVMLAHGDRPDPPPWMFWCKLTLELARAVRRGNSLIGVGLALRMMVTSGGRRASSDLLARFRDQLLLAGT
ncbi:MAG TPA: hypothetical protein VLB44_09845 [Kofleriaceae bacterium]|nr:hypothetical protein [Kofleriaceae bacterium]